ncbi:MAG: thioredoxin family protein [bacterium]|nr:thioredoxin family protein [bacterium]
MIKNKEQIKTIVIGVLAVGILVMAYLVFAGTPNGLSGDKAAKKAIDFVNAKVLTGENRASIDGKVVSESGLYKFNVKVAADSFPSYVSKDGKLLFPQVMKIEDVAGNGITPTTIQADQKTIGEFSVSKDEVCLENGKPIVYFFGEDKCPHCVWEHPIVQKVANQFQGLISFHDNMNNISKDIDIFTKYSPSGSVPVLVIGCKYYRVGTVEPETAEGALEAENNLVSLVCQLTNNQPSGLCTQP